MHLSDKEIFYFFIDVTYHQHFVNLHVVVEPRVIRQQSYPKFITVNNLLDNFGMGLEVSSETKATVDSFSFTL